jgi:hypothetical protein
LEGSKHKGLKVDRELHWKLADLLGDYIDMDGIPYGRDHFGYRLEYFYFDFKNKNMNVGIYSIITILKMMNCV